MQNWLDPAKEIKKQIRSKFVIVHVFLLACLENFHSGVSRPQNLHNKVFPSKVQSVSSKTLDPCDTGCKRQRGLLAALVVCHSTTCPSLSSPSGPLGLFPNCWGNYPLEGLVPPGCPSTGGSAAPSPQPLTTSKSISQSSFASCHGSLAKELPASFKYFRP